MSGPWGDDIIRDWKVSKTNSLTLPAETCVLHNGLFCLIQQSGFVCEFCSSLWECFSLPQSPLAWLYQNSTPRPLEKQS